MARAVHAEAQETNGTAAEAQGSVPPLPIPTRGAGDLSDQPEATRLGQLLRGRSLQRVLQLHSDPTLTARETRAFPLRHLRVRARLLALRFGDPRYVSAGSGSATSRMLGGNATPTALKTWPTSPVTGVRNRKRLPSCSVSISCR